MYHYRYWLWYTTQRCVSGAVRKIYQRLKQFKVQFLVLQRKTDPSQVLLQCLPSNKVCGDFFFRVLSLCTESATVGGVIALVVYDFELICFWCKLHAQVLSNGCGVSCTGREQNAVFDRTI